MESNQESSSWNAFGGDPRSADDPPTTRLARIEEPVAQPSAPAQGWAGGAQEPSYAAVPPAAEPQPPAPPRRRGRLALLLAAAALLGLVGGVGYGYHVQADEPPTALPPLSQPGLKYPAPLAAGKDPGPLDAAHDHQVKTGGDLRKLLVSVPKGTTKPDFLPGEGGWMSVYEFADNFEDPDYMFQNMLESGYRRTAMTAWTRYAGHAVVVQLIQFHEHESSGAAQYVEDQQSYLPDSDWAGNEGTPVPGSGNARLFIYDSPDVEPGYEPLWEAVAIGRVGDVVMEIHFADTKKVSKKEAMALAKKQLERL
ncbi:hypothetical protein AB0M28_19205 [Streptomyces sp. NPDC051940]|uniref:hypothetical protein n=1 Tax=Streptomyces sp. NPDC051940 TaxID=3155675 RepID=UPI00343537EB